MAFLPHTDDDVRAMLAAIGVQSIEALFDEIPATLLRGVAEDADGAMTEAEVMRLMRARAAAPWLRLDGL